MKKIFSTLKAPIPGKTVSQAVINDNLIYVCGQISTDIITNKCIHTSITKQTNLALTNMQTILEAAGSCLENVLSTTVYISSMDKFDEFNHEYAKFFPENPPARATIAVNGIYDNLDVEITCIAALK